MQNRRKFLFQSTLAGGAFFLGKPLKTIASGTGLIKGLSSSINTITIFHTNDLNSQVMPFSSGPNVGLGGLKNISHLLRTEKNSSLLLDAGNFLDASAAFSKHNATIEAMNNAGYCAATVGVKDLALGQQYLADLSANINFTLVNCNYEFSNIALANRMKAYRIINSAGLKIGITGVGISKPHLPYGEKFISHPPYKTANKTAKHLKESLGCDLVICLSNIGYDGKQESTRDFAMASEYIDLIVGGNSSSIMSSPVIMRNLNEHEVVINQGARGGMVVGKMNVTFNKERKKQNVSFKNIIPGLSDVATFKKYQELKIC